MSENKSHLPREPFYAPSDSEPIVLPEGASMSEGDRLMNFFRGHGDDTSKILLSGFCPECYHRGARVNWVMVGIGAKKCVRCGWQDF